MSRISTIFATVTVYLIAFTGANASADERVWTRGDGTTFEATLVGFGPPGGVSGYHRIELRKRNGEELWLKLGSFSAVDREYLAARRIESAGGPAGQELRLKAAVSRQEYHRSGDREEEIRLLNLHIEAAGAETADATCVGELRIDACETNLGMPLKLHDGRHDLRKHYELLTRYGFENQPTTGLEIDIAFDAPREPIQSIARVRGSYNMIFGERFEIIVPRILEKKDFVLDDPRLFDIDLEVVLNPSDNPAGVRFESDDGVKRKEPTVVRLEYRGNRSRVYSVELIDREGNVVYDIGARMGDYGAPELVGRLTRYFHFDKPPPDDLQLRLVVLKTRQQRRIPFEILDVAVPAPSAK